MARQTPAPQLTPALMEPGLIIRHGFNLGEADRIVQFEGFLDRDSPLSEINHLCDTMRKAGNRQKAAHTLPHMRRHLEEIEYVLNDNKRRLAELDAGEKAMDEARARKRDEIRAELQGAVTRAEDEHQRSGRRGEFKAPASVTSRPMASLQVLDEAEAKEHAENAATRATLNHEIKDGERGERAILRQKDLIAEYEGWLRGEDAGS